MISPTYGECDMERVVRIITDYIRLREKESEGFNLIVGTDSQNYDNTKVVVVIAVQNIGHGGIFFYEIRRIKKIKDIRRKLLYETNISLLYADRLLSVLERCRDQEEFKWDKVNFCVHIDAGMNGKTRQLVPELVAWVKATGYDCRIKPDSFAASSIADKLSK